MSVLDLPPTVLRLAPLRAEVDLGAVRHNARVVKARVGAAEVMGVVKADAYGHGAVPVARALQAEGVGRFAVASVPEGVELREAGLSEPVLVLGAPLPEYLPAYARYGLDVTVVSREGAEAASEAARLVGPLTAHVKVDTGLHRLGLQPEETMAALALLRDAPGVRVEGLWTHFATADEDDPGFAHEQAARFDAVFASVCEALGEVPPLLHLANSPAVFLVPEAVRGRALVRAGGALYGLPTSAAAEAAMGDPEGGGLRPAMRLVTRVVHVKTVEAGATVSYGRTWTAERPTRIATLAAGYADGLPRALSNAGHVGVGGRLYPVAGRVCMDLLMLDLGDPDGPGAAVRVGDEAVLFGAGGPTAYEQAAAAGTLSYTLTSGLTARVPRVYVGEDEGVRGRGGAAPRPSPHTPIPA